MPGSEFSHELGSRDRLYGEVRDIAVAAIEGFYIQDPVAAQQEGPKGPDKVGMVEFDLAPSLPLPLQTIGSDHAELGYFCFVITDEIGYNPVPVNSTEHRAIRVGIQLYADGSPFVADGDIIEEDGFYDVVVGKEMTPFIAQSVIVERYEWKDIDKRILSDEDCESIIPFLHESAQNPTAIRSFTVVNKDPNI